MRHSNFIDTVGAAALIVGVVFSIGFPGNGLVLATALLGMFILAIQPLIGVSYRLARWIERRTHGVRS